MARLSTFRDVVDARTEKISPKSPIDATEQFIKYEQPWPINQDKDEKDKQPTTKKQKTDETEAVDKALKQIVSKPVFDTKKYLSIPMTNRKELNEDTRIYTFKHPLDSIDAFHLGIGQHILCAFVLKDGSIVERPYAIVRPTGDDKEDGTIDILVKTAFPSSKDPGGTVSNILDSMRADRHDEMLVRGPEGPISYLGDGNFDVSIDEKPPQRVTASKINFISGGTGMTPIYATIRAILETDKESNVQIRFMDANVKKGDILLHEELDALAKGHERFEIVHVLEEEDASMECEKGLIDGDKLKRRMFPAKEGTISLVCGPPPMMKAAKEGLLGIGFQDGESFFHY